MSRNAGPGVKWDAPWASPPPPLIRPGQWRLLPHKPGEAEPNSLRGPPSGDFSVSIRPVSPFFQPPPPLLSVHPTRRSEAFPELSLPHPPSASASIPPPIPPSTPVGPRHAKPAFATDGLGDIINRHTTFVRSHSHPRESRVHRKFLLQSSGQRRVFIG